MTLRFTRVSFALLLAALAAACANNTPTQPSAASTSVTAPHAMLPADGAQVRNTDQPVTLVVSNATVTKAAGTTYTFEVATDAAFGTKVQTKDGVAEGSSGQTSVKLDALPAAKDYYWHARATSAGTAGVFGAAAKFTVGAAIDGPVPVTPVNGASTGGWPTFRVMNATHSPGVGALVYRFDVATSSTFDTIVLTITVPEVASGQTSYTPPGSQPAPPQNTLFWRATAIEQSTGNVGTPSATQSFTYTPPSPQADIAAQEGLVLWDGPQPPGSTGHARMGPNWNVATVTSFNGVTHVKPTLEELQVYDLIDRGMDPDSAIGWMQTHGYPTTAVWYPGPAVVGFPYEYIAFVNNAWEIVVRAGG